MTVPQADARDAAAIRFDDVRADDLVFDIVAALNRRIRIKQAHASKRPSEAAGTHETAAAALTLPLCVIARSGLEPALRRRTL